MQLSRSGRLSSYLVIELYSVICRSLSRLRVMLVHFVHRSLLPSCFFLVFALGSTFGQSDPSTSVDWEQGFKQYGAYHGGDLDKVSLTNQNLFFKADLFAYSQRAGELAYPVSVEYNSKSLTQFQQSTCTPATPKSELGTCLMFYAVWGAPWNGGSKISNGNSVTVGFDGGNATVAGLPFVQPTAPVLGINTTLTLNDQPIYVQTNSVLTPDGALHQLVNNGNTQVATDGSGFFVDGAGVLRDGKGNKYGVGGNGALEEDANGNQVMQTADSLGRAFTAAPGPATPRNTPPASTASLSACPVLGYASQPVTNAYAWSLPTVNGQSMNLTLCYASVYVRTAMGAQTSPTFVELSQSFTLLQSVVLPDGTFWAFNYAAADPNNTSSVAYGDLLEVTLPTGGTLSYTYGFLPLPCSSLPQGTRGVLTRTVDANDGTGPHTWTYNLGTVTDPLGNDTVHQITPLGTSSCSFFETETDYYQGSHANGTLLKKVQTQYQYTPDPWSAAIIGGQASDPDNPVINVFPTVVTTTLPNGLVKQEATDYDTALSYNGPLDGIQFNQKNCVNGVIDNLPVCFFTAVTTIPAHTYTGSLGKVIGKRYYDWGQGAPGALLRQEQTSYMWQTNPSYLNNNFLDLVASETVLDGNGNQVSQTVYGYDEFPLQASGVSTQHDGSPANGNIRGNLTSVRRWLNGSAAATANCQAAANGYVATYTQYYDTGTVYQTTDACGGGPGDPQHTTTHFYDPAYAGAYSTMTCNPLGQCVSGTYDFNTGLLTSFTNANAAPTQRASGATPGDAAHTRRYTYDDLWRTTKAQLEPDPQGNLPTVSFAYPSLTEVDKSTTVTTALPPDQSSGFFDAVERPVKLVHNSAGNVTIATTYDMNGRTASVTNPFISTSDPTYGVTQTKYDALGRVTQTIKQDGSVVTTAYDLTAVASPNGDCTLATDEAGNPRQTCVDGLGRLIEVDEPASGSGSPGIAAGGSGAITGTEQSTQVPVTPALPGTGTVNIGGGPVQWKTVASTTTQGTTSIAITGVEQQTPVGVTQGTGTVTIGGTEQNVPATSAKGSVTVSGTLQSTVTGHGATSGTGSVSISGSERSVTSTTGPRCISTPDAPCPPPPTTTNYDVGTVSIAINGTSYGYNYGQGDNSGTIASGLASAINGGSAASASASNGTVFITARASGAASNYSLSAADTHALTNASFTPTASGAALSGGSDSTLTTVYDSGTATITVNGVGYSTNFSGSGTTASTIASGLVSALGGNSLVTASSSGGVVTLTAKNPGAAGNVSLSASITHNSSNFSNPSFSMSASGAALTGGVNTIFDAGTVTLNVGSYATPAVSWGQADTPTTIAANLAGKINTANSGAPVTATASGGTVTLTSIAKGGIGNYPMSVAVKDTAMSFSAASFNAATSGPTLTGGWPSPTAVDSGTMTVTIGNAGSTPGPLYQVPWGASDFPGSIASNLLTKITSDPNVTATLSGNTIYLNPKQPGATNYNFSTAVTYDTADFNQSSFSSMNSVADFGTATITVNGHGDSTWWSAGATPTSIASALTSKIGGDSVAQVSAVTINASPAPCGTPPPAVSANALVSFADSNGGEHWAYFDTTNHICSLSYTAASGYIYLDVTALSAAPAATGSGLAGFGDLNGNAYWAYVGTNGHLYSLEQNNGGSYSVTDVTAATGANPAQATSPVTAFADAGGGLNWAWLDPSGHVDIVTASNGSYASGVDLTTATNAPLPVAGSALKGFGDAAGGKHLVYLIPGAPMTPGRHLNEINWTLNGGYVNAGDITAGANAAAATPGSAAAGFGDAKGGQHVAYLGSNQHLYSLDQPSGGSYTGSDITAIATSVTANGIASAAVAGSALTAFGDANGTNYWGYVGANGHAYSFSLPTSGGYNYADLTVGSGAPAAAGTLVTGFSKPGGNGQEQWAYLGVNNNVYQIPGSGSASFFAMSGSTSAGVALTATSGGLGTDYSLASSTAFNPTFTSSSFTTGNSGTALAGGANTVFQTIYDVGTVTLTVGSVSVNIPYQQTTTPASLAAVIASLLNQPASPNGASSPVTAAASGASVQIAAAAPGSGGNYAMSWTASSGKPTLFSQPSFGVALSGAALNGGTDPAPPSLANAPMVTLYSYDTLGNLTCVEQHGTANGTGCSGPSSGDAASPWRVRRFTYDSLSRLLTASNPESGTISYAYDANGNVSTKTSPAPNQPRGGTATQTISFCYDVLNRITGKAYLQQNCPLSSPVATYGYDAGPNGIGHLTSVTDQAGSASYSYDALGRLTTEQRTIAGISKSLSYTYNLNGSIATVTYPSGSVITYTPNAAGQIISAIDNVNGINYVTEANYNAPNQISSFVSGAGNNGAFGGIVNNFAYNPRLQPTAISAQSPTQTVFGVEYNLHAGAGNNGNVWGIANNRDTTRNQSFTYDALNRLTSAQTAGTDCNQKSANNTTKYWAGSYGYDAWGNMVSKTPTVCFAESLNAAADNQNRIHKQTGADFLYDAAGNMTFDPVTGNSYTFDPENRITGAGGYTYTYDADGNRIEKSNGGTGTIYWYTTLGIVGESDLSGNLTSEYVFFDGDRVARKDFPSNNVSYYFFDHLKTASVITDSNGNILSESDYYPWGGEVQFLNNDPNHYKFGGHERDTETQLDYFGARYYGNWTGRFLTPDWDAKPTQVPYSHFGNPQSLNLYSYAGNNPTTFGDPDGHENLKPQDWGVHNDPTPTAFDRQISGLILAGFSVVCPACGRVIGGLAAVHAARTGDKKGAVLNAAAAFVPGGKLADGLSKAAKVERLVANVAQGKAAEQAVAETLKAEGRQILGQQVGVQTSQGLRNVDILTKDAAGQLANVEVKSGNAVRNASQVAKDTEIATEGGTYIGKNAPDAIRGQKLQVPTEVRKPSE